MMEVMSMDMKTNVAFPLFLAILAILAGITLAKSKRVGQETHYDEMQLKNRADGYRMGYLVTIFLMAAYLLGYEADLMKALSPSFAVYAILMLGFAVFAVFCIQKEAFFSIGQKGKGYMISCAVVVVATGALAISRIVDGTLLEDGVITLGHGSSLVMCPCFLLILVAIIYKMISSGKEADE